MATNIQADKKCTFCLTTFKQKYYRSLESLTSVNQYSVVFNELRIKNQGAACGLCTNKLNRIVKLNAYETSIIFKIQKEMNDLIKVLSEMPGLKAMHAAEQQLSPSCSTNKKRPLPRPPTGATPKSKRPLFFTPSKRPSSSPGKTCPKQEKQVADQSTQTVHTQCDFHVKVDVKYKGKERSRIIKDIVQQTAFSN
ncbi:uncharacterized protein LOC127831606 [Dreissena polymorpha]|uniref:uncharacterized protein LOC127831606 n=1 Tax=Dreissena polymorpha TaxID=45954 RepID=UPI002264F1AA|nr:uncharacterized protein LOC127831606 [Dreissena polymorpha]